MGNWYKSKSASTMRRIQALLLCVIMVAAMGIPDTMTTYALADSVVEAVDGYAEESAETDGGESGEAVATAAPEQSVQPESTPQATQVPADEVSGISEAVEGLDGDNMIFGGDADDDIIAIDMRSEASKSFNIVWVDNNDSAHERPSSADLAGYYTLQVSNDNTWEDAGVNADIAVESYSNWKLTFEGLDSEKTYRLKMGDIPAYESPDSKTVAEDGTYTAVFCDPLVVTIDWKDASTKDSTRPEDAGDILGNITVMCKTGIEDYNDYDGTISAGDIDIVKSGDDTSWTFTINNLPSYSYDGTQEYSYRFTLDAANLNMAADTDDDEYEVKYVNISADNAKDIYNAYNDGTITATITGKTDYDANVGWLDDEEETTVNARPSGTLKLWRYADKNGNTWRTADQVLNKDNNAYIEWSWTDVLGYGTGRGNASAIGNDDTKDLDKYDNEGNLYIYYADEIIGAGYTKEFVENTDADGSTDVLFNGGTLYNRHNVTQDVTIVDTWIAAQLADSMKTAESSVGAFVYYIDDDGNYWYFSESEQEDVQCDAASVSEMVADNFDDICFHTADITGFSAEVTTKSVVVTGLPLYNRDGLPYLIGAEELSAKLNGIVDYVTQDVTGKGWFVLEDTTTSRLFKKNPVRKSDDDEYTYIIENILVGENRVTITKTWKDNNNAAGSRPGNISFKISRSVQGQAPVDMGKVYTMTGDGDIWISDAAPDGSTVDSSPANGNELCFEGYDDRGYEYTYYIEELNAGGYYTEISYGIGSEETSRIIADDEGTELTYDRATTAVAITNSIGPGTGREVDVSKKWLDGGNSQYEEPVTVCLARIDAEGAIQEYYEEYSAVLEKSNNWESTIRFDDDAIADDDQTLVVVEYKVGSKTGTVTGAIGYDGEEDVDIGTVKFDAFTGGTATGTTATDQQLYKVTNVCGYAGGKLVSGEVTNTRIGHISLIVNKGWVDGDEDQRQYRPNLVFDLYCDTTDPSGTTKYATIELKKNDDNTYSIDRIEPAAGNELTQLVLTDENVVDGSVNAPYGEGAQCYIINNDDDTFTLGFTVLEKYDANGVVYKYAIREDTEHATSSAPEGAVNPEDYVRHATDTFCSATSNNYVVGKLHNEDTDTYSMTNGLRGTIDFTVYKAWNDFNAPATSRSDLYMTIYRSTDSDPFAENDDKTIVSGVRGAWSVVTVTGEEIPGTEIVYGNGSLLAYTVNDLPKYDDNGNLYYYYAQETMNTPGDYKTDYYREGVYNTAMNDNIDKSDESKPAAANIYAENGAYIVNRLYGEVKLSGKKRWSVAGFVTKQPNYENFKFYIERRYADDDTISTIDDGGVDENNYVVNSDNEDYLSVLDSTNTTNILFTNDTSGVMLPKYNKAGREYAYKIVEDTEALLNDSGVKISTVYAPIASGTTITNVYLTTGPNGRELAVNKTWNMAVADGSTYEYYSPEFKVHLYRLTDEQYEAFTGATDKALGSGTYETVAYKTTRQEKGGTDGKLTQTVTFDKQPIYAPDGTEYHYIAVEDITKDYECTTTDTLTDGRTYIEFSNDKDADGYAQTTFENKYKRTRVVTQLTGTKRWDDYSDAFGKRPEGITLKVQREMVTTTTDGTLIEELTAPGDYKVVWEKTDNSWKWTINFTKDEPVYAPNGTSYRYVVGEEDLTGDSAAYYTAERGSVTASANDTVTTKLEVGELKNTLLKGKLTVTKEWDDGGDSYLLRPTITFNLKWSIDKINWFDAGTTNEAGAPAVRAGVTGIPEISSQKTMNASATSVTFTGLPAWDADNKLIYYCVIEETVPSCTTTYGGSANAADAALAVGTGSIAGSDMAITTGNNIAVKNALETVAKTSIKVTKTWSDDSNAQGVRPESITLYLLRKTGTDGNWGYFKNALGEFITLTMSAADAGVDNADVWEHTFGNLPKADDEGTFYYAATEKVPDAAGEATDAITVFNYICTGEESTSDDAGSYTGLTNALVGGSLTVTKEWNDSDNKAGARPDSVSVYLEYDAEGRGKYARYDKDENITLDDNNDWSYTWENLAVSNAAGKLITYRIAENAVQYYSYDQSAVTSKLVKTGDEYAKSLTLTNTHSIDSVTINVAKQWTETANSTTLVTRPESVTVKLQYSLDDGASWMDAEAEPITLTAESGNWSGAWANQVKYGYPDGTQKERQYRVIETGSNSGYTLSTTSTGNDFTLENTLECWDIPVEKVWKNDGSANSARGAVVLQLQVYTGGTWVNVQRSDTSDYSITLDGAADNWQGIFSGIPRMQPSGTAYSYRVREISMGETGVSGNSVDRYSISYSGSAADGFTVTNSYNAPSMAQTVDITGTKLWIDDSNAAGMRPEEITLHLYADGAEVQGFPIKWVKLNNAWIYTIPGMPELNSNGDTIAYTVSEDAVEGYSGRIGANGLDITNTFGAITLTGTKTWVDNSNAAGMRPENITLHVYADGAEVKDCKITWSKDGNVWKYTAHLPVNEDKDSAIKYTVSEDAVDGYTGTVAENGLDITNTFGAMALTGTKTWVDNSNAAGTRPENITLHVYADGAEVKDCKITWSKDGDVWTYTTSYLPVNDEKGSAIKYTVSEDAVEGYTGTVAENGLDITNTFGAMALTGTKTWVDNSNAAGTRPENITLHVYADGAEVKDCKITWSKDGDVWTYTTSYLPVNDDEGKAIKYTVSEESVSGYAGMVAANGLDITNTLGTAITLTGTKTWVDNSNAAGLRPESIELVLYADGVEITSGNVNWRKNGNVWDYAVSGLPERNAQGETIVYTVGERPVNGYTTSIRGTDITNTIRLTGISGTKTWQDNGNYYKLRPENVSLILYADGAEMSGFDIAWQKKGDIWTYTINGLPVYNAAGNAIVYSISETPVAGYTSHIEAGSLDILNELDTAELTGTKIWLDNNDAARRRPDSIKLSVYVKTAKGYTRMAIQPAGADIHWVKNGSVWTYTISNMPVLQDSEYAVRERSVPNYYAITDEDGTMLADNALYCNTVYMDGGYVAATLYNTYDISYVHANSSIQDEEYDSSSDNKGDDEPDTDPDDTDDDEPLAQTGDSSIPMNYLMLALICAGAGIILLLAVLIRRRRNMER